MSHVFTTPLERVSLHSSGWVPFGRNLEITAAPLVDTSEAGLFARLTYRSAVEYARRIGARLLTKAEHDELWRVGWKLRPVLLSPGPDMASIEYARRHDSRMLEQLVGWDGVTPLANAGKQWVGGAPKGKSWNYGWWSTAAPNGQMWQRLGAAHDDLHTDYSQLVMLVREISLVEADRREYTPAALPPEPESDLDTDLDHETLPGVDAASTGAAGGVAGGVSTMLPHGYRCSVAELVQDARELGTWRPRGSGYYPQRGDLIISARAGGDPTKGGPGHVEVVENEGTKRLPNGVEVARVDGQIITIGGNEGNTWTTAGYDLTSPAFRGCIERGELGKRAVDVALEELRAGIRELPGAQHHWRIQAYHAGARRGGSSLAGMPGHELEGVATLGATAADEVAWCASAASWCLYRAVLAR